MRSRAVYCEELGGFCGVINVLFRVIHNTIYGNFGVNCTDFGVFYCERLGGRITRIILVYPENYPFYYDKLHAKKT